MEAPDIGLLDVYYSAIIPTGESKRKLTNQNVN